MPRRRRDRGRTRSRLSPPPQPGKRTSAQSPARTARAAGRPRKPLNANRVEGSAERGEGEERQSGERREADRERGGNRADDVTERGERARGIVGLPGDAALDAVAAGCRRTGGSRDRAVVALADAGDLKHVFVTGGRCSECGRCGGGSERRYDRERQPGLQRGRAIHRHQKIVKASATIAGRITGQAPAIAGAVVVVALALDGGGYGGVALGIATVVTWLAVLAVAIGPARERVITRSSALAAAALAVLAVLGAFSLGWSIDRGAGFEDVVRSVAYLGAFLLAGLLLGPGSATIGAGRRRGRPRGRQSDRARLAPAGHRRRRRGAGCDDAVVGGQAQLPDRILECPRRDGRDGRPGARLAGVRLTRTGRYGPGPRGHPAGGARRLYDLLARRPHRCRDRCGRRRSPRRTPAAAHSPGWRSERSCRCRRWPRRRSAPASSMPRWRRRGGPSTPSVRHCWSGWRWPPPSDRRRWPGAVRSAFAACGCATCSASRSWASSH